MYKHSIVIFIFFFHRFFSKFYIDSTLSFRWSLNHVANGDGILALIALPNPDIYQSSFSYVGDVCETVLCYVSVPPPIARNNNVKQRDWPRCSFNSFTRRVVALGFCCDHSPMCYHEKSSFHERRSFTKTLNIVAPAFSFLLMFMLVSVDWIRKRNSGDLVPILSPAFSFFLLLSNDRNLSKYKSREKLHKSKERVLSAVDINDIVFFFFNEIETLLPIKLAFSVCVCTCVCFKFTGND